MYLTREEWAFHKPVDEIHWFSSFCFKETLFCTLCTLWMKQEPTYIQQWSILQSHFSPFTVITGVLYPSMPLSSHSHSLYRRIASSYIMCRKSLNPCGWSVFGCPLHWLKPCVMHKRKAFGRWLTSSVHYQSPLSHFLERMLNLSTTFIRIVIKSQLLHVPPILKENKWVI